MAIHMGKGLALGALLILGTGGLALAQSAAPSATSHETTHPSGTSHETKQEQFDRDKVTTKDRIQQNIMAADANIDALRRMSETDKGANKTRDEEMQKKLSDRRSQLQEDLRKIDDVKMADWPALRATVASHLTSMESNLKTATYVTHVRVQVPPSGATNKQPPDEQTQPSDKPPNDDKQP